jgi:hypothetical protein
LDTSPEFYAEKIVKRFPYLIIIQMKVQGDGKTKKIPDVNPGR